MANGITQKMRCPECDESFDSQEQLDEHNRTNGEYKED